MESHTAALDAVCKHFHDSYSAQEVLQLKQENGRLKREVRKLTNRVADLCDQLSDEHAYVEQQMRSQAALKVKFNSTQAFLSNLATMCQDHASHMHAKVGA